MKFKALIISPGCPVGVPVRLCPLLLPSISSFATTLCPEPPPLFSFLLIPFFVDFL